MANEPANPRIMHVNVLGGDDDAPVVVHGCMTCRDPNGMLICYLYADHPEMPRHIEVDLNRGRQSLTSTSWSRKVVAVIAMHPSSAQIFADTISKAVEE